MAIDVGVAGTVAIRGIAAITGHIGGGWNIAISRVFIIVMTDIRAMLRVTMTTTMLSTSPTPARITKTTRGGTSVVYHEGLCLLLSYQSIQCIAIPVLWMHFPQWKASSDHIS